MTVIDALRLALAQTFLMYFKAHAHHWNVTGPLFQQFHGLFGDLYADLHEAVDDLAERLRTLHAPRAGIARRYRGGGTIPLGGTPSAAEMVIDLLAANGVVMEALAQADVAASAAGRQGLCNFSSGAARRA